MVDNQTQTKINSKAFIISDFLKIIKNYYAKIYLMRLAQFWLQSHNSLLLILNSMLNSYLIKDNLQREEFL